MRLRNIPGAKDAILDCEWVIDEPERFKGKWNEVFGVKRPLFLEVGMGKGRFLMDMARLHPERNFVGIEMYDSVLLRALQKREELEAAGEEFSNLVFIRVDARLLPEIFEKDEVDGIYLNFSDPWPKARHAKFLGIGYHIESGTVDVLNILGDALAVKELHVGRQALAGLNRPAELHAPAQHVSS